MRTAKRIPIVYKNLGENASSGQAGYFQRNIPTSSLKSFQISITLSLYKCVPSDSQKQQSITALTPVTGFSVIRCPNRLNRLILFFLLLFLCDNENSKSSRICVFLPDSKERLCFSIVSMKVSNQGFFIPPKTAQWQRRQQVGF